MFRKAELFKEYGRIYAPILCLAERRDFFYGHVLPSTGYLKHFGVEKYYDGLLLRVPNPESPNELEPVVRQEKLFGIFREHKEWAGILQIEDIAGLNEQVRQKRAGEIIKISEALHEKKIVEIANQIYARRDKVNLVLIAGPQLRVRAKQHSANGWEFSWLLWECGPSPFRWMISLWIGHILHVTNRATTTLKLWKPSISNTSMRFLTKLMNGETVERPRV